VVTCYVCTHCCEIFLSTRKSLTAEKGGPSAWKLGAGQRSHKEKTTVQRNVAEASGQVLVAVSCGHEYNDASHKICIVSRCWRLFEENAMERACGTNGGEEECIYNTGGKA
jgi:hypothetical protein